MAEITKSDEVLCDADALNQHDFLVPGAVVLQIVKQTLAAEGHPDLRLSKKALALIRVAVEDEIIKQIQLASEDTTKMRERV